MTVATKSPDHPRDVAILQTLRGDGGRPRLATDVARVTGLTVHEAYKRLTWLCQEKRVFRKTRITGHKFESEYIVFPASSVKHTAAAPANPSRTAGDDRGAA